MAPLNAGRRHNGSLIGLSLVSLIVAALHSSFRAFVGISAPPRANGRVLGVSFKATNVLERETMTSEEIKASEAELAQLKADLSSKTMEAAEPVKSEDEMSDWELLTDRFNTRGGAFLVVFAGLAAGLGLEKVIELFGVDSIYAGIWTSAIFFTGMMVWISQYLFRVMTKSTTYAEQLTRYEQEVMMRRLQELDEDEIEALCAEVGVTVEDLMGATDDKAKALSQKEKVLELFKNTKMPTDPRNFISG